MKDTIPSSMISCAGWRSVPHIHHLLCHLLGLIETSALVQQQLGHLKERRTDMYDSWYPCIKPFSLNSSCTVVLRIKSYKQYIPLLDAYILCSSMAR